MIARIATFEGGDAEEMGRRNNEMLVERATELPAGILRVMVLMKDESRWAVISSRNVSYSISASRGVSIEPTCDPAPRGASFTLRIPADKSARLPR